MPATKKASTSTKSSLSSMHPDAAGKKVWHDANKSPPPPPLGRRTVVHLVTQLQGEMAHHSGYVPQGGFLMAIHLHMAQSQNRPGVVIPPRRSIWNRLRNDKTASQSKKDQGVTVRLLNESEW